MSKAKVKSANGPVVVRRDDALKSKAGRLAVACEIAVPLRESAEKDRKRRVHRYNQETFAATDNLKASTVGFTTLAEVKKAQLAKHALEIEVQPNRRPTEIVCSECGLPFAVGARGVLPARCDACRLGPLRPETFTCVRCGLVEGLAWTGPIPTECLNCRTKRCIACSAELSAGTEGARCLSCAGRAPKPIPVCADCSVPLSRDAMKPKAISARDGRPPRCFSCSRLELVRRRDGVRKKDAITLCTTCKAKLSHRVMTPSAVRRRGGAPPACRTCTNAAMRIASPPVVCADCAVPLPRASNTPSVSGRRIGPARCRACANRAAWLRRRRGAE